MAEIRPFRALRPDPKLAARICELPYDVISSAEARQMAGGNPLSFLHVSKPEIDLPAQVDPYDPIVYAKGADNFRRLIQEGRLRQDDQPALHVYRLVMGPHSQTGWVAVVSCQDYLRNAVKRHELTRPDKEDDRVRHMEALNAQTGPAFLAYRACPELDEVLASTAAGPAEVDFVASDSIRHTAWPVREAVTIQRVQEQFQRMPALYIADGHHRTAAAARVCQRRAGAGASGFFLAVIFPHHQLQILPYNRAVTLPSELSPAQVLARLQHAGSIGETGAAVPGQRHQVCFYLDHRWRTLTFPQPATGRADPLAQLDVTLLQQRVLGPVFGIDDPRTSGRIQFVGGIRGTDELQRLVDRGDYGCAFSLYPASLEDLMAVADVGGIMPPKSTWFEPKLRDAMFCHML